MNETSHVCRLSPMQEGILFHSLSEKGTGQYVVQWRCTVQEPLNRSALIQAWQEVVARHDVLRTRLDWQGPGDPLQVVEPAVSMDIRVEDGGRYSPEEMERRIERYLLEDRRQEIRLDEAPLCRVFVCERPGERFDMIWTWHHAILDGTAARILMEELFTRYHALSEGRRVDLPPPRPYRDFIDWLARQDFSADRDYWRSVLHGYSEPARFPEVKPARIDPGRSFYGLEPTRIEASMVRDLESFAETSGLGMNVLLQTAWAILLSRYCGRDDVCFGLIRACRRSTIEGADSMAGLFINNLPVRIRLSEDRPWVEAAREIRRQNLALRERENTPLALIQGWSDAPKGSPLFDTLVIFDRRTTTSFFHAKGGRWLNVAIREYNQTHYPITLLAFAEGDLLLRLEYDRRRVDGTMIRHMLESLRVLLQEMPKNPSSSAHFLPYLGEEARRALRSWNATRREYPESLTLVELFEQQVERTPEAIAVSDGKRSLTYRALSEGSNQVGRFLQRLAVGPEVPVGVFMERSLELVLAIYGVVKAGAPYVPLDPDLPRERLEFMIADTALPVVLTQGHLAPGLPAGGVRIIAIDEAWERIAQESTAIPEKGPAPGNAAYIIYTSGSTGKPKGVVNEHRGIVNRLLWMQEEYRLDASDRVLQKTPFSFDVSVWELFWWSMFGASVLFWPLQTGARLFMAEPGGHRDSAYLVKTILDQGVTTLHFVPSMLSVFLEEPGVESLGCIKRVVCSGEALTAELQRRFFEKLPAELHNLYGPTEAAVDVTYWACRRDEDRPVVPIGRPVSNTQIHILDSRMQPVPIGANGEIYIGGVQVARGYLNRPELNRERFVPDPFDARPGARLYRTGDIGRYGFDGAVEYLGRVDFQVKIRGFRVELGEIEAQLESCEGVGHCAVVLDGEGEAARLVAYYTARPGSDPQPARLRERLARSLPDYMIPRHFIRLQQLPLTTSGKINRRSLPRPHIQGEDPRGVGPRSEEEKKVAALWCDLLGVERVGIHDNFFEIGGHSLLVMRMAARLRQIFGKELAVVDIFRYPTVEQLAAHLASDPQSKDVEEKTRIQATRQREALRRQRRNSSMTRP